MNNLKICICVIIIIIIIIISVYYLVKNITGYRFLHAVCKKGICYDNIEKCYSPNAYVLPDGYIHHSVIERKVVKCILNPQDKYKLLNLKNIFVPSMLNGTFCDIIYNTYYDYSDYNLHIQRPKKIRIRHYHFQPGIYFEIKYKGGVKVRALMDDNYNLLEEVKIDEKYKEFVIRILDQIKTKKLRPLFQNIYKRLSFVYKRDPEMRITIDSNIEFFYNDIYHVMNEDILEFKLPLSVSFSLANQYLKEINSLAGTNLTNDHFSKPMKILELIGS